MEQIPSGRLRRVILVYTTAVMLLLGLVVATTSVIPLYRTLVDSADSELRHALATRSAAVAQYAARVRDVASQITSRTMIRRKLEALNRGEATLEEATAYITDRLADALRLAPEVAGIARLAADGRVVARLGAPVPLERLADPPEGARAPVLAGIVRARDEDLLMVTAPILDRQERSQGTDVLLIRLQALVEALEGAPRTTLFLPQVAGGNVMLPPGPDGQAEALTSLARQGPGVVHRGELVAALEAEPSTGWRLAVHAPATAHYAGMNRVLLPVLGGVAVVVSLGVAGLLLVLRPLTGRILVHTRDLQAEVGRLRAVRRTLRARAARLARANIELEQLTRTAAHEFQEPLRGMVTHAELLLRRERDKLDPESRDILDWLGTNARRMRRQIDDIRIYMGIGRGGPIRERVDLNAVVNEVLGELRPALRATDAEILAAPLPTVPGRAEELRRLFHHLIDNAIRHRRPDARPRVHVTAEREGEGWRFRISDNGPGIPPGLTGKAFGIFQRLHPGGNDDSTGMGLPICRRIVAAHGGEIWIETAEGGRTAVMFTLRDRQPPPGGRAA